MFSLLDSLIYMDLEEKGRSWRRRQERNLELGLVLYIHHWCSRWSHWEHRGNVRRLYCHHADSERKESLIWYGIIIDLCLQKGIYLTSPCNIVSSRNRTRRQIPIFKKDQPSIRPTKKMYLTCTLYGTPLDNCIVICKSFVPVRLSSIQLINATFESTHRSYKQVWVDCFHLLLNQWFVMCLFYWMVLRRWGRRTRRLLLSIGGYIIDWQEELRKKGWVMRMLLGRGFEGSYQ